MRDLLRVIMAGLTETIAGVVLIVIGLGCLAYMVVAYLMW